MKDFDKVIWRDALTFVDFFATWCGPCQMMHPVIDKFAEQMKGRVDVYKIDIDDREMIEIIRRYNIMSVPTLMFFRRGEVLWRESGRTSYERLVAVLDEIEKREKTPQS
ncbi:MAG: thioredoxin family protein [Alistipes sp.]|nr:thioredoxin family protein [Alistipes sp.]